MTQQQELPPRRAFTCDATVVGRPVRVVFGVGTLTRVAPEARALGGRVLLVAGRHEDEAAERVSAGLDRAVVGRLRDVTQHVPVDLAAAAVDRARELGAGVLVAIGGLLMSWDFLMKLRRPRGEGLERERTAAAAS